MNNQSIKHDEPTSLDTLLREIQTMRKDHKNARREQTLKNNELSDR